MAGFTAAMTVVLLATGGFIYWRVEYALDQRLDADLAAEADVLSPLVQPDGTLRTSDLDAAVPGVSEHQVLDRTGRVLSAGPGLGDAPVLDAGDVEAAQRGPVYSDIGLLLPISKRPLRLLATPVPGSGPAAVLVVGLRRDERDEALRELLGQLAIAGLGALVITAVVGERLAKAALAPVERYRARARSIASGATGVRLDVPTERDDEITRLGHTLNDMLDALDRSLARERRFLDDASHELRTPLTLLSTRVQLALRRPRSPQEHEAVLRDLQTDVVALTDLAEQLLQIGVATGAPAQGPSETGDVRSVVARLTPTGDHAPGARLPATWSVDMAGTETVPVPVPDAALRQVLLNLLGNAAVHGAPPVQVAVRAAPAPEGAVAVLTVSDGGRIPVGFLPHAAERFSRTDDARGRPGAGLGLSLVHELVDRAGGELRLCSSGAHHRYEQRHDLPCAHPGSGTTVTVLLPVVDPADTGAAT
ncbi:sensor histidine kinase [Klenkia brasiliensis]|uniref:sensor histidine kinase n=1 Tax=Klenkia brasiliensis TaxID=333142 RepID=UPI001A97299F|nr:HAMP domain-containing sensor histidine kinase [Klenkia brasiliensis]